MDFNKLISQIELTQSVLQASAIRAINTAITIRNWLIGFYIVEFEQKGDDRAKYGEKLLNNLEKKLNAKGMSERRLREYRRFYTVYPQIGNEITNFLPLETIRRLPTAEFENLNSAVVTAELQVVDNENNNWKISGNIILSKLSFTHLNILSKFDNPIKKAFYEIECIKGCWSVAELERQINTLYFERSGMSKNKEALTAMVNLQAVTLKPSDIINNPIALEFLELNKRALVTETDLEQAILDNLQHFLLEMGRGFCFESRQKRILIDDEYFFADLVFYHRILKCHVIVELKIDKFKHEYASQLNMYLNYFKEEEMQNEDNYPIGILLCTDKGNTQVKYATAGLDNNIFVQKYLIELPNENTLKEYLQKEYKNLKI